MRYLLLLSCFLLLSLQDTGNNTNTTVPHNTTPVLDNSTYVLIPENFLDDDFDPSKINSRTIGFGNESSLVFDIDYVLQIARNRSTDLGPDPSDKIADRMLDTITSFGERLCKNLSGTYENIIESEEALDNVKDAHQKIVYTELKRLCVDHMKSDSSTFYVFGLPSLIAIVGTVFVAVLAV
jgi:hypothetical protein